MYDCLEKVANRRQSIDDHGFVEIIDVMPRLVPEGATADHVICDAARVSYNNCKKTRDDTTLLRYLMRHEHSTPFEMAEVKFCIKCPIFVARQIMRHRTASINEESARYSVMRDEIWIPPEWHRQSLQNNQGSSGETLDIKIDDLAEIIIDRYTQLINAGVSREEARTIMPVGTYTSFVWKCNLRNCLHFLHLRLDTHAQATTRKYAQAMWHIVQQIWPVTAQAFADYCLNAVKLTAVDIKLMAGPPDGVNARELSEFNEKIKALTFTK